jgi:tellurite methyltransferase
MVQKATYFHDHWVYPEVCQLPEYLTSGSVLVLAAGYNGLWLASQGFQVTAAGESPHMVERAEGLGLPVTFMPEQIDTFSPAPKSKYDAVVVLGQLHFLSLERTGKLILQLKQHTRPGGFHVIRAGGDPEPRASDITKESLVPWLEWYSDWRIVQFSYRDNGISSRHVGSPYWLFGHRTTLIAQNESPAQRRRQLGKQL